VFAFELNNKTYKSSTLSRIGVEGYSTPVEKRDRWDPARSEASAAKRVAWNGNHPHLKHHNIHKEQRFPWPFCFSTT